MGLLDKAKGITAGGLSKEAFGKDMAKTIATELAKLAEASKEHIKENVAYLKYVATPLFKALPFPVQLIGRERLKWDAILLDVRNEVLMPANGKFTPDKKSAETVLEIVKKHHS